MLMRAPHVYEAKVVANRIRTMLSFCAGFLQFHRGLQVVIRETLEDHHDRTGRASGRQLGIIGHKRLLAQTRRDEGSTTTDTVQVFFEFEGPSAVVPPARPSPNTPRQPAFGGP